MSDIWPLNSMPYLSASISSIVASAGTADQPTTDYDLVIGYSGTLNESSTNSSGSTDITLNFSMSQPVEVKFPDSGIGTGGTGTAEVTDTAPRIPPAHGGDAGFSQLGNGLGGWGNGRGYSGTAG